MWSLFWRLFHPDIQCDVPSQPTSWIKFAFLTVPMALKIFYNGMLIPRTNYTTKCRWSWWWECGWSRRRCSPDTAHFNLFWQLKLIIWSFRYVLLFCVAPETFDIYLVYSKVLESHSSALLFKFLIVVWSLFLSLAQIFEWFDPFLLSQWENNI